MNEDLAQRRMDLLTRSRVLHGHGALDTTAELARVAEWCAERDVDEDVYGEGELIESFETQLAELFDMPAARLLPSGTSSPPPAASTHSSNASPPTSRAPSPWPRP